MKVREGFAYDRRLEGEAEREREDVPVRLFAPRAAVHAVVRVQEDELVVLLQCCIYGFQGWVVEPLAEA